MSDVSDKIDPIQAIPSKTSTITAATGRVQRTGLITGVYAGPLRLAWKLLMFPISLIAGSVGLTICSIGLGLWVAASVLSYSLTMVELIISARNCKSPSITPVSVSPSPSLAPAADECKESTRKEDQNQLEIEDATAKLHDEKAVALGPEPENGPNVTQVFVRLPNGERKGRRFDYTATLQSLYDFVDSTGCLEVGTYKLVAFFPRVVYTQNELSLTLRELGLHPQASLFVELYI